jgi:Na+-transporting NADH:ubiquinone oxidoreductase subunit NqrF
MLDSGKQKERLELFFTGHPSLVENSEFTKALPPDTQFRRLNDAALESAAGNKEERESSLYYVCGPPFMTDYVVDFLRQQDGVNPDSVLCEKWW